MNNPLAQKAQYYLNESHRLSEELKAQQEYSELLESILTDLLNDEQLDESIRKKLGAALLAAGIGAGLGGAAGGAAGSAEHAFKEPPKTMVGKIEAAKSTTEKARKAAALGALGLSGAGLGLGAVAAGLGRKKD